EQRSAEEQFADVAAAQLLKLIPAELRRRSTWSGYGGTAVARRLLHAFDDNQNWCHWEPPAALSVAEAALAIAQSSDRRTPQLLLNALAARTTVLRLLSRFEDALASLDEAEAYAGETKLPDLQSAI